MWELHYRTKGVLKYYNEDEQRLILSKICDMNRRILYRNHFQMEQLKMANENRREYMSKTIYVAES